MADLGDTTLPVLEARGLRYAYPGEVTALDGLDLVVSRGGVLALLGANGAGKTTLLQHLNGILRPQAGEVLLDGDPVAYDRQGLRRWRRAVGLVLQDPDDQIFAATVAQDVSFGPMNLKLDPDAVRQRVHEALAALHIADLAERPTHMLSFGQKKRVAIAGVLAMRPEVLLLDEPTAGLDGRGAAQLVALLQELVGDGTTILLATHDTDLACEVADRVAVFDHGRVRRQGPPAEVLGDPDLVEAAHLQLPAVIEMGLAARAAGLLAPDRPLPRTRSELCALLHDLAGARASDGGQGARVVDFAGRDGATRCAAYRRPSSRPRRH